MRYTELMGENSLMDNVPVHHNASANHSAGAPHNSSDRKRSRRSIRAKTFVISAIVVAFVAVLVIVGLFFYRASTGATIDSSKYQAVFFTNGQVYFGKLQTLNDSYMKLTDVFYLQTTETDSTNPQETSTESTPDVQLIKLGDEVHGPEDAMIISKDQVLFFENLKKDGRVSASIDQYNGQRN